MIPILIFVYKQTLGYKGEVSVPQVRLDLHNNEIYTLESFFEAASRDTVPLKDFDCKIQY